MDEQAYHQTRVAIHASACVFEKAILSGCAHCKLATRRALAEREMISCSLEVAHINCSTLLGLFRERAAFALHLSPNTIVAHAKLMQLQCGGLSGLQSLLPLPEPDVHTMIQQAQKNGTSLLDLPWNEVVSAIVAWQPRRRSPARQDPLT